MLEIIGIAWKYMEIFD